jgi:hypothetical protein
VDELKFSLPGTWYAYGDAVLDAICGTVRSDRITVVTPAIGLTSAEVRRALKPPQELSVEISWPPPHRVMYTIDTIVITPDGKFFDVLIGDSIPAPAWPLRLMPLTPSLTARDVLRLRDVLNVYPEIQVDDKFNAKIQADIAFFEGYSNIFPDLATTLLQYSINVER